MEFFWFLPTFGDGRYIGTLKAARPATIGYLKQIAVAAEDLGYGGVLVPSGRSCEDGWAVAAALSQATTRLKFLVAVRPGTVTPTVSARMANTINRLSGGRLLLNVVAGGDAAELAGDGVFLSHDDRYAMAGEFLEVWNRLQAGETVDFSGKFVRVKGARLHLFPEEAPQDPLPEMWAGGSSSAGHDFISKYCDVYLTWGEPREAIKAKIADIQDRAARAGRKIRIGLRVQVLVRDTHEEAVSDAERLVSHASEADIAEAQQVLSKMDSVGQRRLLEMHKGKRENIWIEDNLWAGSSLVRGGVGTTLVGAPEAIAERLRGYRSMGIEFFILSGTPMLEEAHRFAELVFPLLRPSAAPRRSRPLLGVMGR
jgi:alkanesulfonate monooxygenase